MSSSSRERRRSRFDIFSQQHGALVGGASLDPNSFAQIVINFRHPMRYAIV